jgi:uncharacterized protein with PQ loop repeat
MGYIITLSAIIGTLTVIIGLLVKILGFPDQFMKNYKRKSTEGLSTIFISLAFISYILWTIHGYLQKDWVLIIGQGAGILTTGMIVFQIIHYRNKRYNKNPT